MNKSELLNYIDKHTQYNAKHIYKAECTVHFRDGQGDEEGFLILISPPQYVKELDNDSIFFICNSVDTLKELCDRDNGEDFYITDIDDIWAVTVLESQKAAVRNKAKELILCGFNIGSLFLYEQVVDMPVRVVEDIWKEALEEIKNE